MNWSRFAGALPGTVAVIASAAVELSGVKSLWLGGLLGLLGLLMLVAWAVPFFRLEWHEAGSEVHLERMDGLKHMAALQLGIDDDGTVGGTATVSGRFWFQRDVVVDGLCVVFWQRDRWCPWIKRELVRASIDGSAKDFVHPAPLRERRLNAGETVHLTQTLFTAWPTQPTHPARHGRFHADLYVKLLVPHRAVRLNLGDEQFEAS